MQKKNFYIEKKFYNENFLLKKTFFTEKNINKNVKYIYIYIYIHLISKIYFYTENVSVTNKIKIFPKYMFILQKKKKFDHKKYIC